VNYYNEHDQKAAQWLRELISAELIPAGEVDTRSIVEVSDDELAGYTQCHFFAGIGGWPLALALAGWPSTRPIWTGSCPCQPFSSAGKQLAQADERHLWPVFFGLIRECRPLHVFGEQVASAIGKGWLDGVSADLEAEGYAVGAAVLGAHSVGAPHIRQRLYWLADAAHANGGSGERGSEAGTWTDGKRRVGPCSDRAACGLADTGSRGSPARIPEQEQRQEGIAEKPNDRRCGIPGAAFWSDAIRILCKDGKARRIPTESALFPLVNGLPGRVGLLRGAGNAIVPQVAAEFITAWMECSTETA
jgi:DNA (cytosine-5)-methyltransferase 1